ncbi:MAG: methyltransferase [Pseudonocardiaceae bacterium]
MGHSPANTTLGMRLWNYYREHPEEGAAFTGAVKNASASIAIEIAACYDLTRFARIVDIGGGQGALLAGLLEAAPQTTGVLFDRAARPASTLLLIESVVPTEPEPSPLHLIKILMLAPVGDAHAPVSSTKPCWRLPATDWSESSHPGPAHTSGGACSKPTGADHRVRASHRVRCALHTSITPVTSEKKAVPTQSWRAGNPTPDTL